MRPFYRLAYKVVEACTEALFHPEFEGCHNVPPGGCLVVANHVSFLDPTTIGLALRRDCFFLARKTLFKPPVMDWLLPVCNVVPIDRDGADMSGLRRIIKLLRAGEAVMLFPEGTRSPDGNLRAAREGAGFVAAKAGVPVLPARIFGSYEAWPKHRKLPKLLPMRVVLGRPFMPEGEDYAAIAARMMEEISRLK